ncbi:MAG: ExbD/TolR family protein [Candidatus Spyradosoma sp.]
MKRVEAEETPNLGFQIAPMLDVVFVILLYFMVLAGTIKIEYEIKTTLPGSVESSANADASEPPQEVTIGISEVGEVSLDEEPLAGPEDKKLVELYVRMRQLADATSQSGQKIIVTVAAEETVKYERIMNVLDVLAKAKVTNVTFSATGGDDF